MANPEVHESHRMNNTTEFKETIIMCTACYGCTCHSLNVLENECVPVVPTPRPKKEKK